MKMGWVPVASSTQDEWRGRNCDLAIAVWSQTSWLDSREARIDESKSRDAVFVSGECWTYAEIRTYEWKSQTAQVRS